MRLDIKLRENPYDPERGKTENLSWRRPQHHNYVWRAFLKIRLQDPENKLTLKCSLIELFK